MVFKYDSTELSPNFKQNIEYFFGRSRQASFDSEFRASFGERLCGLSVGSFLPYGTTLYIHSFYPLHSLASVYDSILLPLFCCYSYAIFIHAFIR